MEHKRLLSQTSYQLLKGCVCVYPSFIAVIAWGYWGKDIPIQERFFRQKFVHAPECNTFVCFPVREKLGHKPYTEKSDQLP